MSRGRPTLTDNQGIEVEIRRGAGLIAFHSIERQGSYIDLLALRWPGDGGVVGGIARLSDDDDEAPLQRLAVNLCDQRDEQEVLVLGRSGLPRLRGRQDPAHRCGLVGRVDEAKRIQAVER